jgi:hypothetical protein
MHYKSIRSSLLLVFLALSHLPLIFGASRVHKKREASSTVHNIIKKREANSASKRLLPLCGDVKKYPGMSNGAFITRDPGYWRYLRDGTRKYELLTCKLKRFNAVEARECLANHNLLMLGDSTMRYQFLSLAYFMEHGE